MPSMPASDVTAPLASGCMAAPCGSCRTLAWHSSRRRDSLGSAACVDVGEDSCGVPAVAGAGDDQGIGEVRIARPRVGSGAVHAQEGGDVAEQRYRAVLAVIRVRRSQRWPPGPGCTARCCISGWSGMRPADSRRWRTGRTVRGRVRTRSMLRSRSRSCRRSWVGPRLALGKRAPLQPATADPRPGRTVTGGPHRGRDRRPTDSLKLKCR